MFRALLTLNGRPASTPLSMYHWFKSKLGQSAAIALTAQGKIVVAQVGLLVELQTQMSTDPMGAIKRDAHHNTTLPKEVSLESQWRTHSSRSAW